MTPAQKEALWFWTVPGPKNPDDPAVWKLAVSRLQELGRHAEAVGVDIALEMYEDTYLGTVDSAVAMVQDINHPRVGLRSRLGKLAAVCYGP